MIIDSSVILAILKAEPDAVRLRSCLVETPDKIMSAGNYLETGMIVLALRGKAGLQEFKTLLHQLKITIAPFTVDHADEALEAFHRFGKGQGHPAQLNFGDCIAYGTAVGEEMPLLFKGSDFSQTDIAAVRP